MGQKTYNDCLTELQKVNTAKLNIKNAIIAKGVAVPDNTPLADYDDKIAAISSSKPEETISETYTTNGTKTLTPSSGSVFSGGTVIVNVPEQKPEETFNITPTNSSQSVNPTSGSVFSSGTVAGYNVDEIYDALDDVNTGEPTINLQNKTATPTISQQSITADSGYDGLGTVSINAVTSSIDDNIQAGNIKKDVAILGVTGTYEGSGGTNYSYLNGTIDEEGLAALGWDKESIGCLRDNCPHYSEQNSDYTVSQNNLALAGVVNENNLSSYETSIIMEYVPYFTITSEYKPSFYGFRYIKACPKYILTTDRTNFSSMFQKCYSLLVVPNIDTSTGTDFGDMFSDCTKIQYIPRLNLSNAVLCSSMFYNCVSLKYIPPLNTSKVNLGMNCMFYNCKSLTTVNGIDFSSMTSSPTQFFGWSSSMPTIQHFIVNGKINFSWTDGYGLKALTSIDYDSVKSILTAMSNCDDSTAKTMAFNITMTDQGGELASLVATCISKGWTITGLTLN